MSDLYTPTNGPSILLQQKSSTDRRNIKIAHIYMNVEIVNDEAAQFHF